MLIIKSCLLRKITSSLDENMKKRYKFNGLGALYFMWQSLDLVSKNTVEKWFQKAGFLGNQAKSYENDEDIIPSGDVIPRTDFND